MCDKCSTGLHKCWVDAVKVGMRAKCLVRGICLYHHDRAAINAGQAAAGTSRLRDNKHAPWTGCDTGIPHKEKHRLPLLFPLQQEPSCFTSLTFSKRLKEKNSRNPHTPSWPGSPESYQNFPSRDRTWAAFCSTNGGITTAGNHFKWTAECED